MKNYRFQLKDTAGEFTTKIVPAESYGIAVNELHEDEALMIHSMEVSDFTHELQGKKFWDCRRNDYFTVEFVEENDGSEGDYNARINYIRSGERTERTSFIQYHIDAGQYIEAKF